MFLIFISLLLSSLSDQPSSTIASQIPVLYLAGLGGSLDGLDDLADSGDDLYSGRDDLGGPGHDGDCAGWTLVCRAIGVDFSVGQTCTATYASRSIDTFGNLISTTSLALIPQSWGTFSCVGLQVFCNPVSLFSLLRLSYSPD